MPHQRILDLRLGIEDLARTLEIVIGQARLQRVEVLNRIEAPRREIDGDGKALVAAEIERRKSGPARKRLTGLEAFDQRFRRLLELDPGKFRILRKASARRQHVPDHEELLRGERIERMPRRGARAVQARRRAAQNERQDRFARAQDRREPAAWPKQFAPRRHFGSVARVRDQSPAFWQKRAAWLATPTPIRA